MQQQKAARSYTLGVRLSPAEAEAVRNAAAVLGLSATDLVRPLALRAAAAILEPPIPVTLRSRQVFKP